MASRMVLIISLLVCILYYLSNSYIPKHYDQFLQICRELTTSCHHKLHWKLFTTPNATPYCSILQKWAYLAELFCIRFQISKSPNPLTSWWMSCEPTKINKTWPKFSWKGLKIWNHPPTTTTFTTSIPHWRADFRSCRGAHSLKLWTHKWLSFPIIVLLYPFFIRYCISSFTFNYNIWYL